MILGTNFIFLGTRREWSGLFWVPCGFSLTDLETHIFSLLSSLLSYLLPLHMLLYNSSFTNSCLFHILHFSHTDHLNDPNVNRKPGAPEFLLPLPCPGAPEFLLPIPCPCCVACSPTAAQVQENSLPGLLPTLYSAGKTFSNVFMFPLPFLFSASFYPVYGHQLSLSLTPLYSNHSSHSFARNFPTIP